MDIFTMPIFCLVNFCNDDNCRRGVWSWNSRDPNLHQLSPDLGGQRSFVPRYFLWKCQCRLSSRKLILTQWESLLFYPSGIPQFPPLHTLIR